MAADTRFAPERKLATVLFADLVGSTALAASQDPERTRALLERFYDAMAEEIQQAGGTLERFAGDAVMAAFGAPVAHEDHAERALHAALAMQQRLAETFFGEVELRIGINTGEVVVGAARAGGSFVTGDAVNVAARLEKAAGPGSILAGARTVAAARGAFEFEAPAVLDAKGKADGVAAARVVRALRRTRPRGAAELGSAFVGREQDVARLLEAYADTVSSGRPQVVTIVGEAGLGKTRLVHELWQRLELTQPRPALRSGRCLSYGTGTAYWPLGEMLREHLGLLDSDPPEAALAGLGQRSILGLALGLDVADGLHPLTARDRFHDAWAEFLTELAGDGPAVVLVEDVHWAEPTLLDLLEHVLATADGPLLVIATARPDFLQLRPGWARRSGQVVELEPLDPDEAARMTSELLEGALPPDLAGLVARRAEGNPFFIEELLGVLLDRRVLARQNGHWALGALTDELTIPDSVKAVLAARIDLLDSAEKEALQAAAVIGRVFWTGPLYELMDALPDLRVLEQRDFIRRHRHSTMAGEREYAIKHALTLEVAYESLPRARRAHLHAALAAWLERTQERRADLAPLIAHHYAAAARPEDADLAWDDDRAELERLRTKALHWLERAAGLAVRRYDIDDGLELLHRALTLHPDSETHARIWRAIGTANALVFRGEAFWTAMQNSLRVCTERATCAQTYSELAFQTALRSSMWPTRPPRDLVRGWIDDALALAEPDSAARAQALIARSFWERTTADAAREATQIADRLGDVELQSHAWGARAAVSFAEANFVAAANWSERRLDVVGRITDPDHVADIYEVAIPAYNANLRFAAARELAAVHDAVVEPLSDHHRLHGIAVLLEVEEVSGGWQRILDLADRTDAAVEANLATPCIRNARSLLLTALAATYAGDREKAAAYERRADAVATDGYDIVLAAPRTWLAIARGRLDELDPPGPVDLASGQTWFALSAAAAQLDALAALNERTLLEQSAPALLRPGTYLEPFALRALGIARDDELLIEKAVAAFEAGGLAWHAGQTRTLLGGRRRALPTL